VTVSVGVTVSTAVGVKVGVAVSDGVNVSVGLAVGSGEGVVVGTTGVSDARARPSAATTQATKTIDTQTFTVQLRCRHSMGRGIQ
jgi:hypothetical protein